MANTGERRHRRKASALIAGASFIVGALVSAAGLIYFTPSTAEVHPIISENTSPPTSMMSP